MKIKATELNEGARKRHLIKKDAILTVTEIERGSGTGLRQFKLFGENGMSVGIFYEDDMPARVLD